MCRASIECFVARLVADHIYSVGNRSSIFFFFYSSRIRFFSGKKTSCRACSHEVDVKLTGRLLWIRSRSVLSNYLTSRSTSNIAQGSLRCFQLLPLIVSELQGLADTSVSHLRSLKSPLTDTVSAMWTPSTPQGRKKKTYFR